MTSSRNGPIDGARGIAVLLVFFSHTSGRDMYLNNRLNFEGIGHIGVYLFFCLSAFLLASKLFKEGITGPSTKRFYIKRFFRIVPLYFLVISLVFTLQLFGYYNERYLHIKNGLTGFLQHLIFYRGDSVFWSVVVEEQFYILVPLWIFLFIRFRVWALVVFAVAGLINFVLYLSHHVGWPAKTDWIKYLTTNDRSSGNYIDIFIFTIILLYFFHYHRHVFENNAKRLALIANVLFVGLIVISVAVVSRHFLIFDRPFYELRFASLLYTLVFTLFIMSVSLGNPINKWLNFSVLRYIGIFGFSIYLLHMFVFQAVNLIELPHYLKFVIAGISTFFLSAVGYYLIEKPSIELSYRIIDRLKLK